MPLPDMRPWGRRPLTIPPTSADAWLRLAVWELWMGMIVCLTLGLGALLITTSPDRIIAVSDLSPCYGPSPRPVPCERIVYLGGALYFAFTGLGGLMLIGVAAWFLWELWSAAEPKPISDDFLRLLDHSFGRDWRNPLTWPWARVLWAYGFAVVGIAMTAGLALGVWTLVTPPEPPAVPTIKIETSRDVTVSQ